MSVQLDMGEALRAVDMGPPAESPKAAAFREFWGDRAELRRYKVRPVLHLLSGLSASFCALVPCVCPVMVSHVEIIRLGRRCATDAVSSIISFVDCTADGF